MKKATLIALIGTVIAIVIRVYWLISNLSLMQEDIYLSPLNIITSLIAIVGLGMIGYFFFTLYKKQN